MSLLLADTKKQVKEILVSSGKITKNEINKLEAKSASKGIPFLKQLIDADYVTNEDLTKIIAQITKVPYVNLLNARVDSKILNLIPQEIAERYMAVSLGEMQNRLVIAMLDADNVQAVDFLSNRIGRPLKVFLASEEGINNILQQYQLDVGKDVTEALDRHDAQSGDEDSAAVVNEQSIKTIVQDSPISKALSAILEYAAKNKASDIHIEPMEKELKIRTRIDGILIEIMRLPKSTEPAMVSRIKILSNLKIDEHRIPQDGQFSIIVDNKPIDLRIAISPVVWGEQVVIRFLDKSGTSLKLDDMGYGGRSLRSIKEAIKASNGMILTSGPTGSGKTTSLYALVQEIKNDEINIVTLEDPVEYKMDGINQIQVNPAVGLTFASGLRSILRQDPDVVMVGEIRDKETAALAVQSALTGHLVFSTLHTNSAAGILPRLLDFGVEPFLIASTVRTVIGQRLVRRINGVPEAYKANIVEEGAIKSTIGMILPESEEQKRAVVEDLGYGDLPLAGQNPYTLYRGKETALSPNGYKGRMGLYEAFSVTEGIQELIMKRATSDEIQKVAEVQGMISMRQDGYLKALTGKTTIDEVNRVASSDSA
ncbi:MAG: ATPase, T2SS/T4P/T4SS family [Candidatus Saccharibacteria bacterium]